MLYDIGVNSITVVNPLSVVSAAIMSYRVSNVSENICYFGLLYVVILYSLFLIKLFFQFWFSGMDFSFRIASVLGHCLYLLSKQRTPNDLIRLRECAGRTAFS